MSPWKVILATMIIFGCGVVTGGLVVKVKTAHPRVVKVEIDADGDFPDIDRDNQSWSRSVAP